MKSLAAAKRATTLPPAMPIAASNSVSLSLTPLITGDIGHRRNKTDVAEFLAGCLLVALR